MFTTVSQLIAKPVEHLMMTQMFDQSDYEYAESAFSWMQAQAAADDAIYQHTGKHLSDIEIKVLQGSWERKTYDDMAIEYGYSPEYLNKDVGNKLWRKLSAALAETVTKRNFQAALRRAWSNKNHLLIQNNLAIPAFPAETHLSFPEGLVPIDSPFYLERNGIESLCYETICKPGALIRIKAPKLMGKTSLMKRILTETHHHNYISVDLDFNSVDRNIVANLDKFLRWFCCQVGRQLKLENQLNDYWDTEILGSNDNCTVYFEEYLLPAIDTPVVLGLDNLDRLFTCSDVIEDFLGMLRSWHEKGKIYPIWEQLRLAIAHSTEVYIPLDMNQSPFNAGVPVELREFDKQQVIHLANIHGLEWSNIQVEELMNMVGGHPYLVRLAMYEVSSSHLTLERLLEDAPKEAGIYSNHLRGHLQLLQQRPKLAQAFQLVVKSPEPVELNSVQIYKLHSMGLVERQDNHVIPRCNLYRHYFQRVLG